MCQTVGASAGRHARPCTGRCMPPPTPPSVRGRGRRGSSNIYRSCSSPEPGQPYSNLVHKYEGIGEGNSKQRRAGRGGRGRATREKGERKEKATCSWRCPPANRAPTGRPPARRACPPGATCHPSCARRRTRAARRLRPAHLASLPPRTNRGRQQGCSPTHARLAHVAPHPRLAHVAPHPRLAHVAPHPSAPRLCTVTPPLLAAHTLPPCTHAPYERPHARRAGAGGVTREDWPCS